MSGSHPPLRPVEESALHLVVDMQRVFAEETAWRVPTLLDIVPAIRRIAEAHPDRTLFTRFVTPSSAAEARGAWRRYYERWPSVTLDAMPAAMLDIVAPLSSLATPDRIYDKTTFSAFDSGDFCDAVARRKAETLILSGAETDVCVLATALSAIDRGLRVIVVADAVTSASLEAHAATLEVLLPRHDAQVEVTSTDRLLAAWPAA